jgi:hypothetical protein
MSLIDVIIVCFYINALMGDTWASPRLHGSLRYFFRHGCHTGGWAPGFEKLEFFSSSAEHQSRRVNSCCEPPRHGQMVPAPPRCRPSRSGLTSDQPPPCCLLQCQRNCHRTSMPSGLEAGGAPARPAIAALEFALRCTSLQTSTELLGIIIPAPRLLAPAAPVIKPAPSRQRALPLIPQASQGAGRMERPPCTAQITWGASCRGARQRNCARSATFAVRL